MTVHAIEITLTRAVGAIELTAAGAAGGLLLAPSADARRLPVLVTAKTVPRAVRKVWKRLGDALPIDVVCTLFPGPDGRYLMSIPVSDEAWEHIDDRAAAAGQSVEDHLHDAVVQALARDRSTHQAKLECSLNQLLRDFTSEEIAGAAARRIVW
ncbi:hypothetical protein [Streptomyces sp. SAI-090]|jgi:hypothetical protein|uniref:hypothetical protein n=1 Tax=Streptomyces sp. SAI-090 TaxID=2940545 RepID=UPI0024746D53|nr:hypothetical protein [Streptomyces sp. SAI-090]MDH6522203.1 hypothetical protein [Streptomyces sp. SAI-090]